MAKASRSSGLAGDGECHIDRAGAPLFAILGEREQAVGGNADERVEQVEGDKITGDEDTDIAAHGEEPGNPKSVVRSAIVPQGGSDDDPEQGCDHKDQRAGCIEKKGEADDRQVAGQWFATENE